MRFFVVLFTLIGSLASAGASEVSGRDVRADSTFPPVGRTVHVAFMGGSITEMDGYRPMVCEKLRERFPKTEFTFTAAGLASTCSMTGAFRIEQDVLAKGPVDLFFVEFAVNDDQDARHDETAALRGMEGIVRHLRRHSPSCRIVMIFFANERLLEEYRLGREAVSIRSHKKVAEHYGIPTINVARKLRQQIDEGTMTWQRYGGVHPAPEGNRLAAEMIDSLFRDCSDASDVGELPPPLDPGSYENGRLLSPEQAEHDDAWTWALPDWPSIPGTLRQNFQGKKLLCAETPGAEMTLTFEGRTVGAFILAGPDAGVLEYRIDDRPPGRRVLYHDFSADLHYPRTVLFEDDLPPGRHRLRVRLSGTVPPKSKGTAARILSFTVQ